MSENDIPVSREELREYTKARLKVFYEKELDVPLVLFNEVLYHLLRIDRIFRVISCSSEFLGLVKLRSQDLLLG